MQALTQTPQPPPLPDPAAVEYLAQRGYDPAFGARPVKRVVQQELETALAKGILRGDFAVGLSSPRAAVVQCRHVPRAARVATAWRPGCLGPCLHSVLPVSQPPCCLAPGRLPPYPPRPNLLLQEEDTVVVTAPGGAKATGLVLFRKGEPQTGPQLAS